jgi:hypothetical protein
MDENLNRFKTNIIRLSITRSPEGDNDLERSLTYNQAQPGGFYDHLPAHLNYHRLTARPRRLCSEHRGRETKSRSTPGGRSKSRLSE